MRRKSLKSSRQIFMLKRYLEQQPDKWPKDEVIKLAKEIKLSRAQVYKWLWDQRNLTRSIEKEINHHPKSNPYFDQLGFKEKIRIQEKLNTCFRKVKLRSQSQDFVLSIPDNVEFAVKFKIPRSASFETRNILKKYGYELIRVRNSDYSDCSEKKEQNFRISEFKQVKEELGFLEN